MGVTHSYLLWVITLIGKQSAPLLRSWKEIIVTHGIYVYIFKSGVSIHSTFTR